MRINIYDHDLTDRVELAEDVAAGEARFLGVRFYLGPTIMHTPTDDDSAAVTFWFHEDGTYERQLLVASLAKALRLLGVNELPPEAKSLDQAK